MAGLLFPELGSEGGVMLALELWVCPLVVDQALFHLMVLMVGLMVVLLLGSACRGTSLGRPCLA